MIKTPSRKPRLNNRHPGNAAYMTTGKNVTSLGKQVESHINRLVAEKKTNILTKFNPEALSTELKLPFDSFNQRRISDYICSQINTKIIPSCMGRIEDLLLTIPSYYDETSDTYYLDSLYQRHYQSLIKGLGDNRTYTVVCRPENAEEILNWFTIVSDVTVNIVLSTRFDYSIWGQDAYVAVSDDKGTSILAEGVCFTRYEEMVIADEVAAQTKTAALQSHLYFQGGNVLGGPTKTLIGADYIWRNTTRVGLETEKKVMQSFKNLFGTDIVALGGANSYDENLGQLNVLSGYGLQPIFHIDMYVTPTGVIGDEGKEVVLLGRPKCTHKVTGRWTEVGDVNGQTYDKCFQETTEQLEPYFDVKPLPLLLTNGGLGRWEERYYNLTFNNVVIENYEENGVPIRRVLMPTYSEDSSQFRTDAGIRRDLEQAAESTWKGLKFEVHKMDGLEDLAYSDGSVHCMTKALRRSKTDSFTPRQP